MTESAVAAVDELCAYLIRCKSKCDERDINVCNTFMNFRETYIKKCSLWKDVVHKHDWYNDGDDGILRELDESVGQVTKVKEQKINEDQLDDAGLLFRSLNDVIRELKEQLESLYD